MESAIVTGANGFIGSNLVKELSRNGVEVYAVVRSTKRNSNIEDLNNVHIIQCEMCNYTNLRSKLNDKKIDVFYHFAWDGTVGEKRADYELQLRNIKYTCDAIKLAKSLNVQKFIFAGSLMEYEYKKLAENNIKDIGINNIYGIAKCTARNMGQVLAKNIGINFIGTIISNIYGVGEISDRLFKSTLKKLINNEKTAFTSCEQLYDFIYIDDAIKAFLYLGKDGKAFKNYYIGNRKPRKLKEYICEIRDCIDKEAKLGFNKIPFHGVSLDYTEFNTDSLYDDFGFIPRVSFIEGIKKTKDWLEENEFK